jgi:hypothetical protein
MTVSPPETGPLYSTAMKGILTTRHELVPSMEDGSPLRAYMLPAGKADLRVLCVSGLEAPIEETEIRAEAGRILREARKALRRESRILPEHREERSAPEQVGLFEAHRGFVVDPVPTVDMLRVRWWPSSSDNMAALKVVAWGRTHGGAGNRNGVLLRLANAGKVREWHWQDKGLNLAALRMYMEHARDPLQGYSPPSLTLSFPSNAAATPGLTGGGEYYYDAAAVVELKAYIARNEAKLPWHNMAGSEKTKGLLIALEFSAPGEKEAAYALYFDGPDLQPSIPPQPLAGLEGKGSESLKAAFRHRKRIEELIKQLGEHTLAIQEVKARIEAARKLITKADNAAVHQLLGKIKITTREIERTREGFLASYAYLVGIAAKKREEIFDGHRRWEAVQARVREKEARVEHIREAYTPVAQKITTPLAQHMTKLPVDLNIARLGQGSGYYVTRQLQNVTGTPKEAQLELVVTDPEPNGLADLQKAAAFFFGGDGPAHLPLLLYAALSSDVGTQTDISGVRTFTAGEAWQRMRPHAVDLIRKNGLENWFKQNHKALSDKGYKATDLLRMSLRFLSSVRVPYEAPTATGEKKAKILTGLLHQTSETKPDTRGRVSFNYAWNPELRELIGGADGSKPSYMYTNREALFSYKNRDLNTAPALQLILENMARAAALSGGEKMETVAGNLWVGRTPGGDEMTLGLLVERLGLYDARGDNLYRRLLNALEAVGEAGPLTSFKVLGAGKVNKWGQKIRLEMSAEYRDLYLVERERREAHKLKQKLAQPFAPRKR